LKNTSKTVRGQRRGKRERENKQVDIELSIELEEEEEELPQCTACPQGLANNVLITVSSIPTL